MIFTISRSMHSTQWLAKIERAEWFGDGSNLLRLVLVGSHKRATTIWLDEDAVARQLTRAIGDCDTDDPAELVGKDIIVVLDRLGEIVTFHAPTQYDYQEDRLAPPPPSIQAFRDREGGVWSEVAVGPKFVP